MLFISDLSFFTTLDERDYLNFELSFFAKFDERDSLNFDSGLEIPEEKRSLLSLTGETVDYEMTDEYGEGDPDSSSIIFFLAFNSLKI